jgi:hypothetical protein
MDVLSLCMPWVCPDVPSHKHPCRLTHSCCNRCLPGYMPARCLPNYMPTKHVAQRQGSTPQALVAQIQQGMLHLIAQQRHVLESMKQVKSTDSRPITESC